MGFLSAFSLSTPSMSRIILYISNSNYLVKCYPHSSLLVTQSGMLGCFTVPAYLCLYVSQVFLSLCFCLWIVSTLSLKMFQKLLKHWNITKLPKSFQKCCYPLAILPFNWIHLLKCTIHKYIVNVISLSVENCLHRNHASPSDELW